MDRVETAVSGSEAERRPIGGQELRMILLHCLALSLVEATMWVAALFA